MRRYFTWLLIGMLFFTGCRTIVVDPQDFVDLDRVYYPLYLYTQTNQHDQTERALVQYAQRWVVFKSKYQRDKQWRPAIKQIDLDIASMNATLKNATHTHRILNSLESVQFSLIKTRQELKYPYYVDQIFAFHRPLGYIRDIVNVRGPEAAYTKQDIARLERALIRAKTDWDMVETVRFDPILFGFSTEKNTLLSHYYISEKNALIQLLEAISTGAIPTSRELYDQCQDLATIYDSILQLFCDFKASQSPVFSPAKREKNSPNKSRNSVR